MTKAEFVAAVAAELEVPKTVAAETVDAFLKVTTDFRDSAHLKLQVVQLVLAAIPRLARRSRLQHPSLANSVLARISRICSCSYINTSQAV